MSKLIINITCPALILSSVTTSQRLESNRMVLVIFGAAIVYYLILPFLAKGCALVGPRNRRSEYACMLIYSNLGFMGIPVANAVLGKEAILYISIFMAIFNISIFSYGILLLGGTGGDKLQFRKMINPGTVSAVAAVLLYLGSVSVPTILLDPITAVGNTTTPLAMMVIGASLANGKVRDLFTEKSMILFTILRLLILPLLAWGVCQILGVQDRLLAGALILISGMPVASNTVMLCTELNRDGDYIAKGLLISTLASVVTIPLISMLL